MEDGVPASSYYLVGWNITVFKFCIAALIPCDKKLEVGTTGETLMYHEWMTWHLTLSYDLSPH